MNVLPVEMLKENWKIVTDKAREACEKSGRNFEDIKILAVSKTYPVEMNFNAMEAGMTVFGENYAQEVRDKLTAFDALGKTHPEWHFIGHLQRNKVKYLFPNVYMIHTVDSLRLAEEISKQAEKDDRTVEILLQVNTSGEDSKSGVEPDAIVDLAGEVGEIENLNIGGLMTIGTFSPDERLIRGEFGILRKSLERVNRELSLSLKHLSMGMTHDFDIAIDEGATMVRVGTAIFGERYYANR